MHNSKITIVYQSIVKDLLGGKEKVEKWSEFLARPKNKWGNDPLEKATLHFLKNEHFLAVKCISRFSYPSIKSLLKSIDHFYESTRGAFEV